MAQELELLKQENLDKVFADLKASIETAAQQGQPAHKVELSLWRQVLELGRQLYGRFLALVGSGDMGETVELPDGRTCSRLAERHTKRLVTIFGAFVLERVVYGSREGQKIEFVPLDNRLQLPESEFSYVLQDWDQGLCVEEAFGKATSTVQRMLGLKQSVDSLERMNVHMATKVADFREDRPRPAPEDEGELLVLSADGKGIVMRREEPASKGHRTKGEKASQKRMAIVGTAYTVDRHVRTPEEVVAALFGEGKPSASRPQPQHKHVWASLPRESKAGEADEAGTLAAVDIVYPWLLNEVAERNAAFKKEMVYLHDGQESLWDACQRHLPQKNSTGIVDLLHVTPRLWQAAHVFFKEGSIEAERFMRERLLKVLQGQAPLVVRGLREMATKRKLTGAKKKTIRKVCSYLEQNAERLRYDIYLARGYPIASGAIEGACRHLIKDRMERAGMHWTPSGAQAMLDVRSTWINGDWEAYQNYYQQREIVRLYPYRQLTEGDSFRLAG
jgi:hypothetical protein